MDQPLAQNTTTRFSLDIEGIAFHLGGTFVKDDGTANIDVTYKLIRENPDFPCVRLGTRKGIRANAEEIDEWLSQRRQIPAPPRRRRARRRASA